MALADAPARGTPDAATFLQLKGELAYCRRKMAAQEQKIAELQTQLQANHRRREWEDAIDALPTKTVSPAHKSVLRHLASTIYGKDAPQQVWIESDLAPSIGMNPKRTGRLITELDEMGVITRATQRAENGHTHVLIGPTEAYHTAKIERPEDRNHGGQRLPACPSCGSEGPVIERKTTKTQHICQDCGSILAENITRSERTIEPIEAQVTSCNPINPISREDVFQEEGQREKGAETGVSPESEGPSVAPTPMLAAALAYAEQGWHVFPCHTPAPAGSCSCERATCTDPGKHPRTARGFKDATIDAATIRQWWAQWPEANIGVAVQPSGLVVVDPDAEGLEAWEKLASDLELPETLTASTGGGGLHLVYRRPDGFEPSDKTGHLPAGIHVRGNGYVIAAPSLHESGRRYAWRNRGAAVVPLPAQLHQLIQPPAAPRPPRPTCSPLAGFIVGGTPIPEHQRNSELFRVASAARGRGMEQVQLEETLLEVNERRCKPPLEEWEVLKIARGVARRYLAGVR